MFPDNHDKKDRCPIFPVLSDRTIVTIVPESGWQAMELEKSVEGQNGNTEVEQTIQ
jgi:hypothetical protein